MDGIIAINGENYSPEQAKVSVMDRGFLYGDQIFEVFVAFGSAVLDCRAHLERLRFSAVRLGLTIPWQDEELKSEIQELIGKLGASKTLVRLVITRGQGFGLTSVNSPPNKVIFALPAPTTEIGIEKNGLALKTVGSSVSRRGAHEKVGFYLPSIVAIENSRENGFDDILWLNSYGEITESSIANLFLIGRDGNTTFVATPDVYSGLLQGITRATVIKLLCKKGVRVEETVINKDELARFDEAFISSTVRGLIPVRRIDNMEFKRINSGFFKQRIEPLFLEHVYRQVGYRFDWLSGKKI